MIFILNTKNTQKQNMQHIRLKLTSKASTLSLDWLSNTVLAISRFRASNALCTSVIFLLHTENTAETIGWVDFRKTLKYSLIACQH